MNLAPRADVEGASHRVYNTMALCEGQLDAQLVHQIRSEVNQEDVMSGSDSQQAKTFPGAYSKTTNAPLNLTMDYRQPHSHFAPTEGGTLLTPVKSTRPLAIQDCSPPKRKRGRPRVDKTDPEYLARQAQLKALRLQKAAEGGVVKVKRQYRKRNSNEPNNGAEPKVKRKYTKRQPKNVPPVDSVPGTEENTTPKKRGRKKKILLDDQGMPISPPLKITSETTPRTKRGRKKKGEITADLNILQTANVQQTPQTDIPMTTTMPLHKVDENGAIVIDSDEEPHSDLGSPGTESLSLDDNLRALQHLHEKYANIHLEKGPGTQQRLPTAQEKIHKQQWSQRMTEVTESAVTVSQNQNIRRDQISAVRVSISSKSSRSSRSSGSGSSGSGSDSGSDSESGTSSSEESGSSESGSINGDLSPRTPLDEDLPPGLPPVVVWKPNQTHELHDSGSGSEDDTACVNGNEELEDGGSLSESSNEGPDKSVECDICHKWYSTLVTMKIHKRVHLMRPSPGGSSSRGRRRVPERYECDCCDATFSRRERLHNHKAEAHRNVMTVRCDVCRRCFEDERELSVHAAKHTADERAGRCTECGRVLPSWDELKRHKQAAHPNTSKMDRGFGDSMISRNSLMMARHVCRLCGKGFGHAHSLTRHLANHSKAIYKCVVCKQTFNQSDELAQHLNSHLDRYRRLKT